MTRNNWVSATFGCLCLFQRMHTDFFLWEGQ